jgi:antitoxin component YwqK of YwqJK toxin-antitoxin module
LLSEGRYKNGELDGVWKVYHENGQLEREVLHKNGELIGEGMKYYENGQLKE